MREVTAEHIATLQRDESVHFVEEACLIEPKHPTKKLLRQLHASWGCDGAAHVTFRVSKTARVNKWEKVAVGDMVLYDAGGHANIGSVVLLASVDDRAERGEFAGITPYDIVSVRERDWSVRCSGRSFFVLLDEIKHSLIWSESGAGMRVALKPWSQM